MKKVIFIIFTLIFCIFFLYSDIHVKSVKRTESFQIKGKTVPEKVEMEDFWFGQDKMAVVGKAFRFIVDLSQQKAKVVIHPKRTYLEIPLIKDKVKLKELLPPHIFRILSAIQFTKVKVTSNKARKKIANWNCFSRDLEMEILLPVVNLRPRFKMRSWLTRDIPIRWEKYKAILDGSVFEFLFSLIKIDPADARELQKMSAGNVFEVASEITINLYGTEISIHKQCLTIAEKSGPDGIYSAPYEYRKLDLFSLLKK